VRTVRFSRARGEIDAIGVFERLAWPLGILIGLAAA